VNKWLVQIKVDCRTQGVQTPCNICQYWFI